MTRQEIIDYCLTFPDAYEDYPFDDIIDHSAWTSLRHHSNKKCFAFISVWNDRLIANLKCDPLEADFLRQAFKDVIPGYHMNEMHWNTVLLDGDVPVDEIKRMIENSYNLIKPKVEKKKYEQTEN